VKFTRLEVQNLRAIERVVLEDLNDFVVIAGPNGCGKSCIFDAIRLLKSIYGGYAANEHLQWFGEFAVNVQDKSTMSQIFRRPELPMIVSATLQFSEQERDYIRANIDQLALPIAWQRVTSQPVEHHSFNTMAFAAQYQQLKPQLDQQINQIRAETESVLTSTSHQLRVELRGDSSFDLAPCMPAQLVFQTYDPDNLGIIEYHSASRTYARQGVGGINLDVKAFDDQRRQQGLYNWQGKYQNVKTELASAYIRSLIVKNADEEEGAVDGLDDLNVTMIELFETFFPDKTYLGAKALGNGNLQFPVKLSSGRTHDIDELSSGEKEILYGYLRLKNSTPKGSIILLDEPELHLNPSLLQGFADFYYRHLGIGQGNQLWMVTHSDTLLRQAVGNSNYDVFHMRVASSDDSAPNQTTQVFLDDEVERVTIDLVGDLATYQPHSRVVIFEGDGADGFDVNMVRRLFPAFARRTNLVSGGNKARVKSLYEFLEAASGQVATFSRFFAITDRDYDLDAPTEFGSNRFTWDRYHIENYLFDWPSVRAVVNSMRRSVVFESDDEVSAEMKLCASQLVQKLAMQLLQRDLNQAIVAMVHIKGDPNSADYADALYPSVSASIRRIGEALPLYTRDELRNMGERHLDSLNSSLEDDRWIADFPGREVLKLFVSQHVNGIAYDPFVNLVLGRMAESGVQPDGMKSVLDDIASTA
jgi:ABC-type iron transport system FetAB ATPase subunit